MSQYLSETFAIVGSTAVRKSPDRFLVKRPTASETSEPRTAITSTSPHGSETHAEADHHDQGSRGGGRTHRSATGHAGQSAAESGRAAAPGDQAAESALGHDQQESDGRER